MEHVVFFAGADGSPGFRRVASLEDAVRFVEHLRNVEGVSEVSVHALAEVPLAFRPYYRVEVAAPAEPAPAYPEPTVPEPTVAEAMVAEASLPAAEPVVDEPVVPAARADGDGELEPAETRRGLGFFTH